MILVHGVTEYCCKWLQFDFEQHFNPDSQKEYHLYLDYTKCVDVNVQISISTFQYSHNFAILSEP